MTNLDDLNRTLEALYGDARVSEERFEARLGRSLGPRGPDMLYDRIGSLALGKDHYLLDAGCRDAAHTCELVHRYGCRAIGVDPIAHNIDRARRLIASSGLAERVRAVEGRIEAIPAGDREFDFIWCRDVLNHIRVE